MFANMKTGTKILLSFAVAVAVAAGIGVMAYVSAGRIGDQLTDISDVKLPSYEALALMDEAQTAVARGVNAALIRFSDDQTRAAQFEYIDQKLKTIAEYRKRYEQLPHGEAELKVWRDMQGPWLQWERDIGELIPLARQRHDLLASGKTADSPELKAIEERIVPAYRVARVSYAPAEAAIGIVKEQTKREVEAARTGGHAAIKSSAVLIALAIAGGAALLLVLGLALSRSIGGALRALLGEAQKLTTAVNAGRLAVRGDPEVVAAEFQPIVAGMNGTIDAFVKPIQVTAEYVDRISKGDLPPKITEPYEGDFDLIKRNLNTCIDAVRALTSDTIALSGAAVEGRLTARADATKHQGDYAKIVQGVNETLDAVVGPINEAAKVLEKLAAKDLKARVEGDYRGDHARIKEALNATAEALHEAIAQVSQSVEQVSAASSQIASSSQAVASGASEQAASLQETSSSLESMAAMTKQATDNAQQANGLAQQAKVAAAEGSAAMEQMTGAMAKIKASAEGTSQIIKDINEITFQTNLLALNAAVEAARAGEAGRGFAVVAEEVRSLALRSKEAATKTEELIRQSVREAGEGEVTSKHVQQKLGEITGSVMKVSDIVAEIAAASKEQAAGIDQVTRAVAQMNQVTQQNAASSEESSSAAAELSGQSEELAAMVATFTLDRAGAAQSKSASPPVREARSRAAARKPARANHQRNGLGGAVINLTPAELIPLDGDPVLKEF